MQAWLGPWEGEFLLTRATYLRLYTREGELVLWVEEEQRERADKQRERADKQRERADKQRERADAAEQEVARLRALLAQQAKPPEKGNGADS